MTGTEDREALIRRAEELEQAMHAHAIQRRTNQAQLSETEHALAGLADAEEAYRIVGTIMIKADPRKLTEELADRKHAIGARIAAAERQEKTIRAELDKLQKQVIGE